MNTATTKQRIGFLTLSALMIAAVSFAALPAEESGEGGLSDAERKDIAIQAATLFRSARAVISKNQALINDASKGDKGLTAEVVIAAAKENYKNATGAELPAPDASTVAGRATTGMLDAVTLVMNKAQPLINEKGKGFKGFLPAIFAKGVADAFTKNMEGTMAIKLTAPKAYVRNRANRPDSWEHDAIEKYFKTPGWKNGSARFERAEYKGKDAFRFILPEYYKESCLKCHGSPKGELDITGGKKEGGKLGELGGAISVVILE